MSPVRKYKCTYTDIRLTYNSDIEVAVLFITLDMIETLVDPENGTEDAPFEYLCCRQWPATTIRVSAANGLLAVARSPDILSFYDLETEEKSTIKLGALPVSQMPVSK